MRALSKVILSGCVALALTGCNKIPVGYLSEPIVYTRNPCSGTAGKTTYSETANRAGSSRPIQFGRWEGRNEKGEMDKTG